MIVLEYCYMHVMFYFSGLSSSCAFWHPTCVILCSYTFPHSITHSDLCVKIIFSDYTFSEENICTAPLKGFTTNILELTLLKFSFLKHGSLLMVQSNDDLFWFYLDACTYLVVSVCCSFCFMLITLYWLGII